MTYLTGRALVLLIMTVGGAPTALATETAAILPTDFPTRFPMLPGAQLTQARSSLFGFFLTLRVDSAAQGLEFYRQALPRAGYHLREGSLRPSGGLVPGQKVRQVGGLSFTSGSGYAESDSGGVDGWFRPEGETLDILVPRVGPEASTSPWPVPSTRPSPRTSSSVALSLPAPFPWPPSHRNASFSRSSDGVLTIAMTVDAGPTTYAFYETSLRAAGYETHEIWRPDTRAAVFQGRLAFRGHGQAGYLTVTADQAAARCAIRFFVAGAGE
jgi:hypothetical protein